MNKQYQECLSGLSVNIVGERFGEHMIEVALSTENRAHICILHTGDARTMAYKILETAKIADDRNNHRGIGASLAQDASRSTRIERETAE